MAFNGSGTFSLVAGNPVTTGTTISSTWANNTLSDIATGLTTCLTKDGQSTPTANIGLGGFRITNLGAATGLSNATNLEQIIMGQLFALTSLSGANTITAIAPTAMVSLTANQFFNFRPSANNTGAATLNPSSIGATSLEKFGTIPLSAGDLVSNRMYMAAHDGTRLQVLNPSTLQPTVQARLTLASGNTPVPTSDQVAKTSVILTPYKGNQVPLFVSGALTQHILSAEISISVPATSNTPFDIFAYSSNGTIALETTNWASTTLRTTALSQYRGMWVKDGDTSRLFMGTGCTTGTASQCEDSISNGLLWNNYNRVARDYRHGFTANRSTSSSSLTEINTEIRINVVTGLQEDGAFFAVTGIWQHDTNNGIGEVAIGFDTTNSPLDCIVQQGFATSNVGFVVGTASPEYPSIGRRFLTVQGRTASGNAITFIGAATASARTVLKMSRPA